MLPLLALAFVAWTATGFLTSLSPHYQRVTVLLPGLPPALAGLRIVQLTDIHHGPWLSLDAVAHAVEMANAAQPDVIVLTGDYVHRSPQYIAPCYQALSRLRAPLGVYSVFGNHDQWEDPDLKTSRRLLRAAGIVDLTNAHQWLGRGEQRLCLAGVADMITQEPDLPRALEGLPQDATVILLTHSPDFAEEVHDPRVKLVLAGHTHGGQVVLPLLGPPVIPSEYDHKYASGLVQADGKQVYISRGLGKATLPFRFRCPPEITVLTLQPAPAATSGR